MIAISSGVRIFLYAESRDQREAISLWTFREYRFTLRSPHAGTGFRRAQLACMTND
jgi:DNA polymerase IIIc chi subunit